MGRERGRQRQRGREAERRHHLASRASLLGRRHRRGALVGVAHELLAVRDAPHAEQPRERAVADLDGSSSVHFSKSFIANPGRGQDLEDAAHHRVLQEPGDEGGAPDGAERRHRAVRKDNLRRLRKLPLPRHLAQSSNN